MQQQVEKMQKAVKSGATGMVDFDRVTAQLKASAETLTQRLEKQREKVQTLETAYKKSKEETGENSEKTKKLAEQLEKARGEVTRTENALKNVEYQLEKTGDKTYQLSVNLKGLGEKLQTVGKNISDAGGKMTTHLTAPILAAAAASVKLAGDYEEAINKVSTLDLGASEEKIGAISAQIMELSNTSGVAATDLAQATYDMGSALGALGDDAVEYVEVANKAAIGGFTDTSIAVDGLSTVMNTYGLVGAEAMNKVSDQMLMAQNLGKTTFGQLAQSMGDVVPITNALDISTDELMATYAVLTKNGLATNKATTGLKAALSSVIKPTEQAAQAAELLDIEFSASAVQSKGLTGFLEDLRAKVAESCPQYMELVDAQAAAKAEMEDLEKAGKKNTDQYKALSKQSKQLERDTELLANAADSPIGAYATLFGSVEGLNSMMILASDRGMADMRDITLQMGNAAGATEAAYDRMQSGTNASMRKAVNGIKNAGISIGTTLLPYVQRLAEGIQAAVVKFDSLDDSTKNTILQFAGFAAVAGPVVVGVGKVTTAIGAITKTLGTVVGAVKTAGVAFGAMAGPAGWIALAVAGAGALGLALANLPKKVDPATEAMQRLADRVAKVPDIFEGVESSLSLESLKSATGDTLASLEQQIQDNQDRITEIYRQAKAERVEISAEEKKEIEDLQRESDEDRLEQVMLAQSAQTNLMRELHMGLEEMTADHVAQVLTDAEAARAGVVETAENQYKQIKDQAMREYYDLGQISETEMNSRIRNAQRTKDEVIASAQATKNATVSEAISQYAELNQADLDRVNSLISFNDQKVAAEQAYSAKTDEISRLRTEGILVDEQIAEQAYKDYVASVEEAAEGQKNALNSMNADTIGAFGQMIQKVNESGATLTGDAARIASGFVSAFEDPRLPADMRAAANEMLKAFNMTINDKGELVFIEGEKAGQRVAEGLKLGQLESQSEVAGASRSLAENGVKQPIAGTLEIYSPSRVATRYGGYVGQGLANGVNNSAGTVSSAAASIASGMLSRMRSVLGINSPSVKGEEIAMWLMKGVGVGVDENMEAALAPLDALKDRIYQAGRIEAVYTVQNPEITRMSKAMRSAADWSRINGFDSYDVGARIFSGMQMIRNGMRPAGQGGSLAESSRPANVTVNQYIYAQDTSYAAQQREAAKEFKRIAREVSF